MQVNDKLKPSFRSQSIRYVLISLSIVATIWGLMIQNKWAFQTEGADSIDQSPLLAVGNKEGGMVEVALTSQRDKKDFLVVYEVDLETYKFHTLAYKKLKKPIQEITYNQNGNIIVKQEGQWSLLNSNLMDVKGSLLIRGQPKQLYSQVVTKKEGAYLLQMKKEDQLIWDHMFNKRPVDAQPLSKGRGAWVVLLEDFSVNIMEK